MADRVDVDALVRELSGAALGDARRSRRLGAVVERVASRPNASFPSACASEGELEGVYRFLSNEHVRPEAILAPHLAASVERAKCSADPLVVHDTSHFVFEGEREGLGRLHQKDQGFWGHFALAVDASRSAFGVVGLRYGTRHGASKWSGSRRLPGVAENEPSEAARWPELALEVDERFGRGAAVHVMDREADWSALYAAMLSAGVRFVIRLTHDRVTDTGEHLSELWRGQEVRAEREVELSARAEGARARDRKRHPARGPRLARLHIQAMRVALRNSASTTPNELNVVRVEEQEPPEGQEPVVWNLVTTEDVSDEAAVLRVVDIYRARWVIEEFFKALKTGCAIEKRQLGSYAALLNALAVLAPIAWALLRLRDVGRRRPTAPALDVLDRDLLAVLLVIARKPMPAEPTARDVMYAVAGLGGHLPRNGDPGWITLGRGMERLLEAARTIETLRRSDQS